MQSTVERNTKRKPKKYRPTDIPPEFRAVMEERKKKYGIALNFTLKQALDFALDRRGEWDPFFEK